MNESAERRGKMAMIFPDFEGLPLKYRAFIPPLGLLTIAANTPKRYDVEFYDGRVETIPEDSDWDIVVISAMTPQATKAYELADSFRERGAKVVLGGAHPSLLPDEAILHADAVIVGEAEGLWEGVIDDLERGKSKGHYVCLNRPDLSGLPRPRYDLLKDGNYLPISPIQVTRGCPYNCEFCAVPKNFGRDYRIRPIDEVVSEIPLLNGHLYFVDDNILMRRRKFTELFGRMEGMEKQWLGMAPLNIASDRKYVELLKRSGCWSMYVDIGPWISMGLKQDVSSLTGQVEKSMDYINILQDGGIKVMGSFVFGFDHDDESIFDSTLEFLQKSDIVEAEFLILTPYPKTPLSEKLSAQGRIIDYDWSKYNTMHAVFKPKQMTPERLEEGVAYLWREFYDGMDRVDESLCYNDVVDDVHKKILKSVPNLFRDITHNMVLESISKRYGDIDPLRLRPEHLITVWKEDIPSVIARIVMETVEGLGY